MQLLLWIFLGIASGKDCPHVSCGDVVSDYCADFSETRVMITPCKGDSYCDIDFFYNAYYSGEKYLPCIQDTPKHPSEHSFQDLMTHICDLKPLNDSKLKHEQVHPIKCNHDSDCKLLDGSHAQCRCGLSPRGNSYCELAKADDEVLPMYDSACRGDLDQFMYYFMKYSLHVYLVERPSCADIVFDDIAVYDYLYSGGSIMEFLNGFSSSSVYAGVIVSLILGVIII